MNTCSKCGMKLEPCIDIVLNAVHYCPNCICILIQVEQNKLKDTNILKDDEYTYVLSRAMLIRFLSLNLTKKQYFEFKEKYPNCWYLHGDFYDEDGNRLQPRV